MRLRMNNRKAALRLVFACAMLSAMAVGCGNEAGPSESVNTPPEIATPSDAALVALGKADAVDGTIDKVVSKCLSCKLAMDGKVEHAAHYGEYTLHLCSDHCKMSVEKDPEKALLSLN